MTINEFVEQARALGFDVERGPNSHFIARNDKTFARVERGRARGVDTMFTHMSKLDEETGLSLMALLFEFASTPVNEREDDDYHVYTTHTDNETVGHRLYVTSYGNSGKKLMLDVGIGSALYTSYDRAVEIAEQLSKNTGMKFEVESAER